jgi:hypothetical protein
MPAIDDFTLLKVSANAIYKNVEIKICKHTNKKSFRHYWPIYVMLFRTADGTLVELNRYDFKTDKIYYQKIMELMKKRI